MLAWFLPPLIETLSRDLNDGAYNTVRPQQGDYTWAYTTLQFILTMAAHILS